MNRITGPAYWASYFVNGDTSSLTSEEILQANAWLEREQVNIVGVARDQAGQTSEPRFTWHFDLYAPECGVRGGEVIDYVTQ